MIVLYLDQNYASRIAKYLIGQVGHAHFGMLYHALRAGDVLIPPSPFHVLETRGGYLLPTLMSLYREFSRDYWLRPWLEVVSLQVERDGIDLDDLLTRRGSWEVAADLEPLEGILELELEGSFLERAWLAREQIAKQLSFAGIQTHTLPFFWLLSRFLAFRSLDAERYPRASDLADLVMAATVAPYVDLLATDRYMRELMERIGFRGQVFSGRHHEVVALARLVEGT